jgi:hypothetical protein
VPPLTPAAVSAATAEQDAAQDQQAQFEAVFLAGIVVVLCRGQVRQRLFVLLARAVDEAVARSTKQPRARLFDRRRKPVSLHEFVENILQDVLGIVGNAYPAPRCNAVVSPAIFV